MQRLASGQRALVAKFDSACHEWDSATSDCGVTTPRGHLRLQPRLQTLILEQTGAVRRLTEEERKLSALSRASVVVGAGFVCALLAGVLRGDDWPQWRGPRRDGVWRESGVIEKFEGPEIKTRWRAEVAGGYCGPTVAEGRVYVSDRVTAPEEQERVHCLDAATGRKHLDAWLLLVR